jgi:hypothetical protein
MFSDREHFFAAVVATSLAGAAISCKDEKPPPAATETSEAPAAQPPAPAPTPEPAAKPAPEPVPAVEQVGPTVE